MAETIYIRRDGEVLQYEGKYSIVAKEEVYVCDRFVIYFICFEGNDTCSFCLYDKINKRFGAGDAVLDHASFSVARASSPPGSVPSCALRESLFDRLVSSVESEISGLLIDYIKEVADDIQTGDRQKVTVSLNGKEYAWLDIDRIFHQIEIKWTEYQDNRAEWK